MSEEKFASLLLQGVKELQAQSYRQATVSFATVGDALCEEPDLADVYARVLSLHAQSLLGAGDLNNARIRCHEAMRVTRGLGDAEGLTAVRALDEQIGAELDRERRDALARANSSHWLAKTIQEVEDEAKSSFAAADALIKHANAHFSHSQPTVARESAARAVYHADLSSQTRERVLSRLSLAQAAPERAEKVLLEALSIADRADETTLISLIAKTADHAGVDLPRQYGPGHSGESST